MANTKPPSRPPPEQFDESTKVHSSADIDEILRQASGGGGGNDDFDLDEHTKIGPAHELAAQSMAVPDPMPAMPTPTPRPANVIRRSSPSIPVVRASAPMPAVEALATGSVQTRATSPVAEDDDPFAAWQEFDAPAPAVEPAVPAPLPPGPSTRTYAPAPVPMPMPMPAPSAQVWPPPLPEPAVPSLRSSSRRTLLLAAGIVLAVVFAGGAFAYSTITTLERRAIHAERAAASAHQEAVSAREAAAESARQIDATKTELFRVRAALDAANAELAKRPPAKRP